MVILVKTRLKKVFSVVFSARPVIECPDTFLAMPGESNVTIACTVKSRPLPNLNEVVWSIVNETAPRRMSPGERRDEYSVSMKVGFIKPA